MTNYHNQSRILFHFLTYKRPLGIIGILINSFVLQTDK